MKHIIRTFLWFTITLGWVGFARSDEIGERSLLVLTQYSGGLRFDLLKLDGTRAELWDLSNQFAIGDTGDAEWVIISSRQIRVSPSGNAISWTAFKSEDLSQSALFVLDLERKILKQTEVPYPGEVQWSPDETKILLSQPISAPQDTNWPLAGTFVWDISAQTLIKVGGTANETHWLGNKQFLNTGSSNFVFVGRADREEISLLMGLYQQNLRAHCLHVWSEAMQRLLFIEGCSTFEAATPPTLSSIDLTNNVRFEADLGSLFQPNTLDPLILGIYISEGDVFIAVRTFEDFTPDPFNTGDEILRVQLAKLTTNQTLEVIYMQDVPIVSENSTIIREVSFSPNNRKVALGFGNSTRSFMPVGRLVVLDLDTNGIDFTATANGAVCDLTWINTFTLAYSQNLQNMACSPSSQLPASHITLADLKSGTTQNISVHQGESVWLIPIPDSAVFTQPDIVLPDR